MRIGQVAAGVAAVSLMLFSNLGAHAQHGSVGMAFTDGGMVGAPGEPYTAVRKSTVVQKLANGVTITRENSVREARDSSGRTYREMRPEMPVGTEDQGSGNTFYSIFDPVAKVTINWNSNSTEANEFHFGESGGRTLNPPVLPPTPPHVSATVREHTAGPRPEVEDLGTKNINGVDAQGTRITRTIAVGSEGNDQAFTVTSETWRSTALKATVLQINDDPRSGVRTTELTDIQRGEPDPALFQAPQGYTIKERFPERPN